jgi:hypothetical protein
MKQKITLIYENEYTSNFAGNCGTPRKLTVELSGDISLTELLEQFNYFVKGIGYFPPDNAYLEYVDNDTQETKSIP